MRKIAFSLLFIFLCLLVQAQKITTGKFTIQGKTSVKPDGDIVLLRAVEAGREEVARVKVGAGNSFKIEAKISEAGIYRLVFSKQSGLTLLIDRGEQMTILPDAKKEGTYEIKGSPGTEAIEGLKSVEEKIAGRYDTLVQAYTSAMASGDSAAKAAIEEKIGEIEHEYKEEARKYIQNLTNPVAAVFVAQVSLDVHSDMSELAVLAQKYASSSNSYVKMFVKKIDKLKKLSEGQMAPDFTQNNTDEKPVKLSSTRGKYILIDFWASWCGPCRQENPELVNVYQEFKNNNFDILGVSLDNDRGKWLKAIENDQLTWMHVSDLKGWDNAVAKEYIIQSIPYNFLLDPEGKIVAKNLRAKELRKKLQEIFLK